MTWKRLSPDEKCEVFEEQLKSGHNSKGATLTNSDIAFRQGYIKAVKEQNSLLGVTSLEPKLIGLGPLKFVRDKGSLFGVKKATPEQIEAYKAKRRKILKH